jgi:5-hydroxyisourate hydrolase
MHQLSTHVLDTARGQPAAGVAVNVERLESGGTWTAVGQGVTNTDGRVPNLLSSDAEITDGDYRFIFATADYFRVAGAPTFYPEVTVRVRLSAGGKYHIPLLLSPFGYSTYRGS